MYPQYHFKNKGKKCYLFVNIVHSGFSKQRIGYYLFYLLFYRRKKNKYIRKIFN